MSGDHKGRKTGEDNRKDENDIAWSREIKGTKADSARDEKKKVEEKYDLGQKPDHWHAECKIISLQANLMQGNLSVLFATSRSTCLSKIGRICS